MAGDEVLNLFGYEFWKDFLSPDRRKELEPRAAGGKAVLAPVRPDGESVVDQITHPDDIAMGFFLAIDKYNIAKNNVFNIGGPSPFRYLDIIERVARGLKVPWESVVVTGVEPYEISCRKAEMMLGYRPEYTIEKMIDRAVAGHRVF